MKCSPMKRTISTASSSTGGSNGIAGSPSFSKASKASKASYLGHLKGSAPRSHTVSVALPGSIVANHTSPELRTYLSGQIARSLGIFQVDEVIVYDDKLHSKFNRGFE